MYELIEMKDEYTVLSKNKNIIKTSRNGTKKLRRSITVVLKGEEIYYKELNLPGNSYKYIENIVENELLYCFKNIDNILYDFIVKEKNKNSVSILLYYVNIEKSEFFMSFYKDYKNINSRLKGISLVQFQIVKHFGAKIKHNNYILIYVEMQKIYFILIVDQNITINSTMEYNQRNDNLNDLYCAFLGKCSDRFISIIEAVYLINFTEASFKELKVEQLATINLGSFTNKELLLTTGAR